MYANAAVALFAEKSAREYMCKSNCLLCTFAAFEWNPHRIHTPLSRNYFVCLRLHAWHTRRSSRNVITKLAGVRRKIRCFSLLEYSENIGSTRLYVCLSRHECVRSALTWIVYLVCYGRSVPLSRTFVFLLVLAELLLRPSFGDRPPPPPLLYSDTAFDSFACTARDRVCGTVLRAISVRSVKQSATNRKYTIYALSISATATKRIRFLMSPLLLLSVRTFAPTICHWSPFITARRYLHMYFTLCVYTISVKQPQAVCGLDVCAVSIHDRLEFGRVSLHPVCTIRCRPMRRAPTHSVAVGFACKPNHRSFLFSLCN